MEPVRLCQRRQWSNGKLLSQHRLLIWRDETNCSRGVGKQIPEQNQIGILQTTKSGIFWRWIGPLGMITLHLMFHLITLIFPFS